jgi:lipoate-protein ligase B
VQGPKAFVQGLEEVLLRTLDEHGIAGGRRRGLPGIWIEERKIASIGLHIRRGVTMHGFALNVEMDLAPFEDIVPCGIPGCRMTSMAAELGRSVGLERVRGAVARHFAAVFDLDWRPA